MRRMFSACIRPAGIAAVSTILAASGAVAANPDRDSFCHGYIKKALGEAPIEGLNRNDMWLAWHETVQTTLIVDQLNKSRYQEGRDTFSRQMAAQDIEAMEDVVEGDCELGQNPTWRWW